MLGLVWLILNYCLYTINCTHRVRTRSSPGRGILKCLFRERSYLFSQLYCPRRTKLSFMRVYLIRIRLRSGKLKPKVWCVHICVFIFVYRNHMVCLFGEALYVCMYIFVVMINRLTSISDIFCAYVFVLEKYWCLVKSPCKYPFVRTNHQH